MHIQIHPVDHCNLCCTGCNSFSPLIQESFADLDEIKKDLTRLAELTGSKIGSLSISGGEPLLHPNISEIITSARKYFPGQNIDIITNGILLESMSEDFWSLCKNNNVTISLTCYPIKINVDLIKKLAKMHSVDLVFQDDTDIREKTMYFTPLDPTGSHSISENYTYCYMSNYCFVLENGKLYTCPTIAHIKYFNEYFDQHFEVSEHDYIDIYKAENIDEILTFFCKPMPFCKYCKKKERVSGLVWSTSKREISEWM